MQGLSIILPVHNEEQGIERYITNIVHLFKDAPFPHEILCIENGSSDRSLEILKNLEKIHPRLKVYQSKKGWGNAVIKGINSARMPYICYLVSDGQVDPNIIFRLYKDLINQSVDMIKVTRVTRESAMRKFNSQLYNILSNALFQLKTYDINGTPKIMSRDMAKKLQLQSGNIAVDLELLIKMKTNHLSWQEIHISSFKRTTGQSSTNVKAALEMIKNMLFFLVAQFRWKNMI